MVDEVTEIEEEVVETPEVEVDPEQQHWEDRARRMGWRPQNEYGGNPSRWVDAKTFVERGETELPILRERLRKLDSVVADTQSELRETRTKLTESTKVLIELREMSRSAEERSYARAKTELEAREREAVREASEEKYNEIQRERRALEESRKAVEPPRADPPAPASQEAPQEVKQWVAENQWFLSDRVLNAVAIEEDTRIKKEYPGWSIREQLDEVKRVVMAKFPEKFGDAPPPAARVTPASNAPRRNAPPTVAVSTAAPLKPKGKTVKDLPAEAKQALARFKSQIPGYTDEEYLKTYFAGQE